MPHDNSNTHAWAAYCIFSALHVALLCGLVFAVPVFAEMFADFGAELPRPTQIVIDVSFWLKSHILLFALVLIGPLVGSYYLAAGDEEKQGDAGILWGFALCMFILLGCAVAAMSLPMFRMSSVVGGP